MLAGNRGNLNKYHQLIFVLFSNFNVEAGTEKINLQE
jgi:hypothetical protein